MINTIARRLAIVEVFFRPTLVQGDEASRDIVRAIGELNSVGVDVIIIGRGGGSIEDLWCFNEETVADAIVASKTPIISAVGHENRLYNRRFLCRLSRVATNGSSRNRNTTDGRTIIFCLEPLAFAFKVTRMAKDNSMRDTVDSIAGSYLFRSVRDKQHALGLRIDDYEEKLKLLVNTRLNLLKQKLDASADKCRLSIQKRRSKRALPDSARRKPLAATNRCTPAITLASSATANRPRPKYSTHSSYQSSTAHIQNTKSQNKPALRLLCTILIKSITRAKKSANVLTRSAFC
jgi:exodeoxyribonuclease VII large subunit